MFKSIFFTKKNNKNTKNVLPLFNSNSRIIIFNMKYKQKCQLKLNLNYLF